MGGRNADSSAVGDPVAAGRGRGGGTYRRVDWGLEGRFKCFSDGWFGGVETVGGCCWVMGGRMEEGG